MTVVETFRNQLSEDRRGIIAHVVSGLLFPIIVFSIALAFGRMGFAAVIAIAVFYPLNKLTEWISGPPPFGTGTGLRVLAMITSLVIAGMICFFVFKPW